MTEAEIQKGVDFCVACLIDRPRPYRQVEDYAKRRAFARRRSERRGAGWHVCRKPLPVSSTWRLRRRLLVKLENRVLSASCNGVATPA